MRGLTLLGFAIFVALAAVGCGPPKCACPGCTRPGRIQAEYGDNLTNGALKRETVHICDEHYDGRPAKWPGEFNPETRTERLARQKKAAEDAQRKREEGERLALASREAFEKRLSENELVRSDVGDALVFKPKFTRTPKKDAVLALVYSQPGAPPLDEKELKVVLVQLPADEGELSKGVSPSLFGASGRLFVTVIAPRDRKIADGVLAYYYPHELSTDNSPTYNGGTYRPGRITGAVAEFEADGPTLRFVGLLTPVCEAKPFPKAD